VLVHAAAIAACVPATSRDVTKTLIASTSSPATQPATVSLQNLAGSFAAQYNVQMAGALMTALPTLIVYLLLGRYFVRGLLAGSLKG
jgi:glucose/mannose transport system permease protein